MVDLICWLIFEVLLPSSWHSIENVSNMRPQSGWAAVPAPHWWTWWWYEYNIASLETFVKYKMVALDSARGPKCKCILQNFNQNVKRCYILYWLLISLVFFTSSKHAHTFFICNIVCPKNIINSGNSGFALHKQIWCSGIQQKFFFLVFGHPPTKI